MAESKVIHNAETGELAVWDGQNMQPLPGKLVTNQQTGEKALWDGKTLTKVNINIDPNQPTAKADMAMINKMAGVGMRQQAGQNIQEAELGRQQAQSIAQSPEFLASKKQEGKEGLGDIGNFALRAAPSLALGGGAAALAAKLGLKALGTAGLSAAAGGAGEAAGQAVMGEKLDPASIGVGAAFPPAVQGAQAGARGLLRFVTRQAPGADSILREEAAKKLTGVPGVMKPTTSAKALYAQVAEDPNIRIQIPATKQAMVDLQGEEGKIFPGLQSGAVKRATKGAAKIPDEVDFSTAQANLRRLGARIQQAEKGITQEDAGALRQLRAAMFGDMEKAGEKFTLLKQANRAFNREMTAKDFGEMIANATRSEGGQDLLNADALRNAFGKALRTDRLFRQGFDASEVKSIDLFLKDLAAETKRSSKIGFAVLGGGIGATAGSFADSPGLGAGLGAVLVPQAMEKILMSDVGRKLFLGVMKQGGGKVSRPALALIANTVRAGQGEE